ncbi:hypothetical protein ACEQ8H_006950 [Pleosporales sp. CAS-2024a]
MESRDCDALEQHLYKFLLVFYTVWLAVIRKSPKRVLESIAGRRLVGDVEFFGFEVREPFAWTREDPTSGHNTWLSVQYAMLNKCMLFCVLFEHRVTWTLLDTLGLTGVNVAWRNCFSRPRSFMFDQSQNLMFPYHSVLEITSVSGRSWIFDGTIAQYGRDCWLWRKADYYATCVRPKSKFFLPTDFERDSACWELENGEGWDASYWRKIDAIIGSFFRSFDWDSMADLAHQQIRARVGQQIDAFLDKHDL